MIRDLAQRLKNDKDVWCGTKVDPLFLQDCKDYLKQEDKCPLPQDYVTLLRYVNGAFSDTAYLFGIQPEAWPGLDDVIEQNEQYNQNFMNNVLFLGVNDFDWLVYDAHLNSFQVRSRLNGEVVKLFPSLEDALVYWFKLN